MSRNVRLGLIIGLILLVAIFIFQNVAEVEIRLFLWTIATRRAYMVFTLLVIGVLIGWFLRGVYIRRQSADRPPGD